MEKDIQYAHMKTSPKHFEEKLYAQGFINVCGIDEVGRGPLAGPVAACAVILPPEMVIPGVYDSKKLTANWRVQLAAAIKEAAVAWSLGWADVALIDEINILQATYVAMQRALAGLTVTPSALLIDGLQGKWLPDIPATFIKGGDIESHSIAAASIIAKVARDEVMQAWHEKFPMYGFDKHKGYGTPAHRAALQEYGACPIHRTSFLKKVLA